MREHLPVNSYLFGYDNGRFQQLTNIGFSCKVRKLSCGELDVRIVLDSSLLLAFWEILDAETLDFEIYRS